MSWIAPGKEADLLHASDLMRSADERHGVASLCSFVGGTVVTIGAYFYFSDGAAELRKIAGLCLIGIGIVIVAVGIGNSVVASRRSRAAKRLAQLHGVSVDELS
ncbi:hypothetical protein [Demequina sp.]|uniref:hypothetical protein n=1 Tax=Demequina sp. TaxID=2050685 RepID=UPI003D0E4D64